MIFSFNSTNLSSPLLLPSYICSIVRLMDSARNTGRDLIHSCSLSKDAIFTRVATASSAVGASPIV